jgi:hypothetical protein
MLDSGVRSLECMCLLPNKPTNVFKVPSPMPFSPIELTNQRFSYVASLSVWLDGLRGGQIAPSQ